MKMPQFPRTLFLVVLLVCAAAARAEGSPQQEQERERIARARTQAQQNYDKDAALCGKQFAVTDCEQQAAKRKRAQVDQLNREENVLKDQERKAKAAKQLSKIDERAKRKAQEAERSESSGLEKKIRIEPAGGRVSDQTTRSVPVQVERDDWRERKHQDKLRSAQEHKSKVDASNEKRIKPAASGLAVPR